LFRQQLNEQNFLKIKEKLHEMYKSFPERAKKIRIASDSLNVITQFRKEKSVPDGITVEITST
jgi:hypothetical protein